MDLESRWNRCVHTPRTKGDQIHTYYVQCHTKIQNYLEAGESTTHKTQTYTPYTECNAAWFRRPCMTTKTFLRIKKLDARVHRKSKCATSSHYGELTHDSGDLASDYRVCPSSCFHASFYFLLFFYRSVSTVSPPASSKFTG